MFDNGKIISFSEMNVDVPIVSTKHIIIEKLLGKGYFASVFLVYNTITNANYALKISKQCKEQEFELNILKSMMHENILRMYSACFIDKNLACVIEFAAGGSLSDLLTYLDQSDYTVVQYQQNMISKDNFDWKIRIRLSLDIIRGLNYLHQRNLIHRDLSSQNIFLRIEKGNDHVHSKLTKSNDSNNNCNENLYLHQSVEKQSFRLSEINCQLIDDEITFLTMDSSEKIIFEKFNPLYSLENVEHFQAIVGDMGLVLDLNRSDSDPMEIHGNPFYTAPEILLQKNPYSHSSDIFAFGLLCCELILCVVNDGSTVPRVQNFGLDSESMIVPVSCPSSFYDLAKECCSFEPDQRPTGVNIESTLSTILSAM